jgi:hypothetical protein
VARIPGLDEHYAFTQLTSIKLALQLLERRSKLSDQDGALLQTALQATDRLSSQLIEQVDGHQRPAASVQAEQLQDHDNHHDGANQRNDAHLVGSSCAASTQEACRGNPVQARPQLAAQSAAQIQQLPDEQLR